MKRVLCNINKLSSNVSIMEYRSKYINVYRRVLRQAKRSAVQFEIANAKYSSKGIWDVVNKHRNKSQRNDRIILEVDKRVIDQPQEVADLFSAHFTSAIQDNASDTGDLVKAMRCLKLYNTKYHKSIIWTPFTTPELLKTVQSMKNKKSCGHDEIPILIIKENIDLLAEPFAILFNKCFDNSIFPDQLKVAKILPVYKKGKKKIIKIIAL